MSDYKNTPAFPRPGFPDGSYTRGNAYKEYMGSAPYEGMTLLDYMAGQALIGLSRDKYLRSNGCINTAYIAYCVAKAMLKEKERIEGEAK